MYSEYGSAYRNLFLNHWWWRAREEAIVGVLRERFRPRPGARILDVGCGDGLFFDRLREFGEAEGIEPAEYLVDPLGPHRSRITIAPFDESFQPRRRYDLILMLDVLEHLDAPVQALRHAISLLEPHGLLLITVPAFNLIWTNHDRINQHRTRYTKASFRRIAEDAGIQILLARYLFFWLFPVKLAARAKESLLRAAPQVPQVPARAINRFLFLLSRGEEKLSHVLPLPLGSSLLVMGSIPPQICDLC